MLVCSAKAQPSEPTPTGGVSKQFPPRSNLRPGLENMRYVMRLNLSAMRIMSPRASLAAATALTLAAMLSSATAQTGPTVSPPQAHVERSPATTAVLPAPVFLDRQIDGETRAANLIGIAVTNKANETVGDIVDIVFKPNGQVTAVIIGVGGLLGLGEKNVAVPYDAVAIATDKDGKRSAVIDTQLAALQAAPAYVSERTTFERVQDGVQALAKEAQKKAVEIKNNMSAPTPAPAPQQ